MAESKAKGEQAREIICTKCGARYAKLPAYTCPRCGAPLCASGCDGCRLKCGARRR